MEFDPEKMAHHLKRFFDNDETKALQAVQELLSTQPDIEKDQAFQTLSSGKGVPKSHLSNLIEGGDEVIGSWGKHTGRSKDINWLPRSGSPIIRHNDKAS